MNVPRLRPAAAETVHPVVLERRVSDLLVTGAAALVAGVVALALTLALPHVSFVLVLGAIAAIAAIVALMSSGRLDLTVALIVLYLGLLDGPVKLMLGQREVTAALQDVLILAVGAGALMRIVVRREPVRLPALFGWVFAWTALVVMNAFNPRTEGILHTLGGFRQQLQYVPFFFFAYVLMRSKRRFRQYFVIVTVMALANGVVGAYQTGLSPSQLASWGPGYRSLIYTEGNGGARVYASEGEGRVRPPGLGSDQGFSGLMGEVALPACLALLVLWRKRRWLAALLCLGAMIAVAVGLARLALIGAGLSTVVFAALAALSGRRVTRSVAAVLALLLIAVAAGALLASTLRSGTFRRYERIGLNNETTLHQEGAWSKIPKYVAAEPLGFGLGTSGPVSGFGGKVTNLLEGHGLTSETEYNVLVKELGVPGLVLWPAMTLYVMFLIAMGMRRVRDPDLAICLAGSLALFFVFPIEGFSAFLGSGAAIGPYYWFALGVAGYWFAGPGRGRLGKSSVDEDGQRTPA
ncbi:MAG TPA: hypothetical protein VMG62_06490 [Solirubrobacteraceae bacterium]|nr:hypothetical protein [Solirubrobacteraceae bacterium]